MNFRHCSAYLSVFFKILQRMGYAVALAVRPNVKYAHEFEQIEARARQAKRGIWK